MKKIYLLFTVLFTFLSNAQTITQSTSQEITDDNSVACADPATGITSENSFYRNFDLATFGITGSYSITSVEFGIEGAGSVSGTPVPIVVNLYSTTLAFPASFPTGYTLIGTQNVEVVNQELTILSVPISAVVPAGEKLVVEILSSDLTTAQGFFGIGSNAAGQSGPSYIKAPGCSITTPTDFANIGFPNIHIVMNVLGTTLSINENLLKSTVIYPNPAKDLVSIQVPNEVEVTKVTLTDNTGKVFTKKMNNNTISIADFASGVYFLTIETDKGSINRKIVKI